MNRSSDQLVREISEFLAATDRDTQEPRKEMIVQSINNKPSEKSKETQNNILRVGS